MKKVLFSLFAAAAICAGATFADAASKNDKFTVRFRENTLVVTSTQMTEARLYTHNGRLLDEKKGRFAEFELQQGNYVLCACVNGETIARKVVLK